ncbi:2-methylcitrate dehydratase [hydrothermal vent metagenome]|uniref:2-methylcitrate dehydratase n=1 Tax=hydrothermal vent metagenome TaxID=652676 RepID=A0A3B1AEM2_9ZZZZ
MSKRTKTLSFDSELKKIVHYCYSSSEFSTITLKQAHIALLDAMSCALMSLQNNKCIRHLGPVVPDAELSNGARVPGTNFKLDPIQSSYNISCMIRWLDYNDTWLAKEWGHPSDNIGAILSCADYHSRHSDTTYTMLDILSAMIKAYEIQGILALENSFNALGFDHVILVRIASTALSVMLLGGNELQMLNALSNAFADGVSLRVYRHGENTEQRKSWAAADASSRGVRHAIWAIHDEPGYASVLSDNTWGFNHVVLKNQALIIKQQYQHYVIDNILYKICYPVEFHAQTAVECAIKLYEVFVEKYNADVSRILKIKIYTQQAAMKIINKSGELRNAADRDHCIQYAVSIALINGSLTTEHYHDNYALEKINREKIRSITDKIIVYEDPIYTTDYYDNNKRAIANRIHILFDDQQEFIEEVIYPIGHSKRRKESLPLLEKKYVTAVSKHYSNEKTQSILNSNVNFDDFLAMTITEWMTLMQN